MKQPKTIYYVFSGRFPSEKAHALYIAKVADAFLTLGHKTVLVVSNRGDVRDTPQQFFATKNALEVVYLPALDLYKFPIPKKIAFFVHYTFFSVGCFLYFLFHSFNDDIIFSNESFPSLFLTLMGKNVVYEMHDYPENYHIFFQLLYAKVFKILSQNQWKKEQLLNDFTLSAEKIIVEPNGVEIEHFKSTLTKEEAREQLGLEKDAFIAMYTGHLFNWKGADTFAEAARLFPGKFKAVFVGGTQDDIAKFKALYGNVPAILLVGFKPHAEVHMWLCAADCLILPNTAKMDISKYYTSPMKLFEYMASKRPIIASDLPSIRALADENVVTFVTPDDPVVLKNAIVDARQKYGEYQAKTLLAKQLVQSHSWTKRAERLLSQITISQ